MINDINILVILKGPNNIYIYIITLKQGNHKKCLKLPSKNYNSLCEKNIIALNTSIKVLIQLRIEFLNEHRIGKILR